MSRTDIYREALRLGTEVENRKTQVIAYQSALDRLAKDFKEINDERAIDFLTKRVEEAREYIKIWTR